MEGSKLLISDKRKVEEDPRGNLTAGSETLLFSRNSVIHGLQPSSYTSHCVDLLCIDLIITTVVQEFRSERMCVNEISRRVLHTFFDEDL